LNFLCGELFRVLTGSEVHDMRMLSRRPWELVAQSNLLTSTLPSLCSILQSIALSKFFCTSLFHYHHFRTSLVLYSSLALAFHPIGIHPSISPSRFNASCMQDASQSRTPSPTISHQSPQLSPPSCTHHWLLTTLLHVLRLRFRTVVHPHTVKSPSSCSAHWSSFPLLCILLHISTLPT
jgi:hypothetical protein